MEKNVSTLSNVVEILQEKYFILLEEFHNFKKKIEFKNECDDENDKYECVEEKEDEKMTEEDNIEVVVETTVGKDNAEKETTVFYKENQTSFGLSIAETEAHLVLSELKESKKKFGHSQNS